MSTNSHNPDHVKTVPDSAAAPLESTLMALVDSSQSVPIGGGADVDAPSVQAADPHHSKDPSVAKGWIAKLWPSPDTLDHLFAMEHMGNYVIDRDNGNKKIWESMPIYVRAGMHLLFVSGKFLDTYPSVEKLLLDQSIKQGKLYDEEGSGVLPHIQTFIKTYDLPLNELLVQDLTQYPNFNAFFSRRLLPTARPITAQDDNSVITSPADCRLTVWPSIDLAKQFWVKGKKFSIPELLGHDDHFNELMDDTGAMLAIARLAPQDYHRFHAPISGVIEFVKDIPGQLYTVNPQAINEGKLGCGRVAQNRILIGFITDLDVFTLNKRSVMLIRANLGTGKENIPVAFVAVGAMLVGSIGWSKKPGDTIRKGEELGWFAYGGSTTIVVFPAGEKTGMKFDADLVQNSESTMESLVKVGDRIGSC